MGREILFRGKRIDNGEWVFGYLFDDGLVSSKRMFVGSIVIEDYKGDADDGFDITGIDFYEVTPETVCQYTGLTDKNGRKIFEGDICKDGDNIVRILWNDKHQWGVEISKTDKVLSRGLIFPLWQYDNCEENGNRQLEVIGNIYDNPELIANPKCGECKCRNCFSKSECCPQCEGAILGCEEYSETDIYKPDLME